MISPDEALRLVIRHAPVLKARVVPIDTALHHVLAEDVRSPIALPVFDNSAMDGYALRSSDARRSSKRRPVCLPVVDTVHAGDTRRRSLDKGESCRIMTGAPVPRGADAVVAREQAVIEAGALVVRHPVEPGQHIRRRGEEVRKGARILEAHDVLGPGAIACLATIGRAAVRVIPRPGVSVITTGDETVAPGARLRHGQIYDSNSRMIGAALRGMGVMPLRTRRVGDRAGALARSVAAALRVSDVLVIAGGVSVGDRDHVRHVLQRQRVREVFWRVSQKPGKPLYFGTRGRRLVFGLPGNPASAFTCFYLYVYPALRRMSGYGTFELPRLSLEPSVAVAADPRRWRFLKGKIDSANRRVEPLPGQGSHMITSLAAADGLIVVPPAGERGRRRRFDTYRLPVMEDE